MHLLVTIPKRLQLSFLHGSFYFSLKLAIAFLSPRRFSESASSCTSVLNTPLHIVHKRRYYIGLLTHIGLIEVHSKVHGGPTNLAAVQIV